MGTIGNILLPQDSRKVHIAVCCLCPIVLSCVQLCYVALCCDVLSYVVLDCSMLFDFVLHCSLIWLLIICYVFRCHRKEFFIWSRFTTKLCDIFFVTLLNIMFLYWMVLHCCVSVVYLKCHNEVYCVEVIAKLNDSNIPLLPDHNKDTLTRNRQ